MRFCFWQIPPRALIDVKKESTPHRLNPEMFELTAYYPSLDPAPRQQHRVGAGEPEETGYMSPDAGGNRGAGQRGVPVAFGARTTSLHYPSPRTLRG